MGDIDRTDERGILERFRSQRDEASFRALYRALTPYLWGFARRLTGGRDSDAEDLVQECWTRAVERLDGFRGESAPRSWLAGILLNCWRESRRELRWVAEAEAPDALDRRTEAPRGPELVEVERALAALPDGSRAVMVMFDLLGHTHDEIAKRLAIPAGTSKRRLFDARRALRRRLRGTEETSDDRA